MTLRTNIIILASVIAIGTFGCGTEHEDNRTHSQAAPATDSSTDTAAVGEGTKSFTTRFEVLQPFRGGGGSLPPLFTTTDCMITCGTIPRVLRAYASAAGYGDTMTEATQNARVQCASDAWAKMQLQVKEIEQQGIKHDCITPRTEEYRE